MLISCEKRKKIYSQWKTLEKSGVFVPHVDENGHFHRLFMSNPQVIPIMWITCGFGVDGLGMRCE